MAIDASAVARVLGIETVYKDLRAGGVLFLPQRIAVLAQGSSDAVYSTSKYQATSAGQVGSRFGFGSPAHLVARALFPANGDGVGTVPVTFYPLTDAASSVAAVGTITPTGTASKASSFRVSVNNILSEPFVIAAGATIATITAAMAAAVSSVLEMPVTATSSETVVTLTSRWKGASANGLRLSVVGESNGITFGIVQPTGGLVNPDLTTTLAKFGGVWESLVLNALDIADTAALDAIQTFGDGRWGELVRKPFVAFTGNTAKTVALATAVSATRRTDKVNAQLVAPGSDDLPFVVAARQLARIARVANNNPPTDYGSQRATGLTPGADADQWDSAARDQAAKAGSSTIEVKDGVVCLSDIVTFYRPTGEEPPAYRFVVDIVKLQNVLFNIDLIFNTAAWDGAPLIPDDQPTVNPNARKPKSAVAAVNAMIDSLALNAIISDPKTAKKNTHASISAQNPKRLDLETSIQLSGNTNVKDITLAFGFYFGAQTVVA